MKNKVEDILRTIVHPETGADLLSGGMASVAAADQEGIKVVITPAKARDPFANSLKKLTVGALAAAFPEMAGKIDVTVAEPAAKAAPQQQPEQAPGLKNVKRIIAISSGKGGVGKSTVAANLAVTFASMGYKTGLLDADVYGPSQPRMFGFENYTPPVEKRGGHEMMIPAPAYGVEVMSIGFFISKSDALLWRGPMATGALRQLIHQTDWGKLDLLLIDMPPGTGDVHLTLLHEMRIDGAVIVSTPQQIALADVMRGVTMFSTPGVDVPVLGVVENMAWFTPAEIPGSRYYIFGKGGAAKLAQEKGLDLLGEIPIEASLMEGADEGKPAVLSSAEVSKQYEALARNIVNKLK